MWGWQEEALSNLAKGWGCSAGVPAGWGGAIGGESAIVQADVVEKPIKVEGDEQVL